jgi:hypothetical protein
MGKLSMAGKLMAYTEEGGAALLRWLKGSPKAVELAASRLGLVGADVSIGSIVAAAKNNPVTTALLLVEAGSMGSDALSKMTELSPEIAQLANRFGLNDDKVTSETVVTDIGRFQDEFTTIKNAANIVGGYDRLISLRHALGLEMATYTLYEQVKGLRL